MINLFELLDFIFPKGVYYDNTTPKGTGQFVTLNKSHVEITDREAIIIHDDYLFYGVAMSFEQVKDVVDNRFNENGEIICNCGRIVYKLNENAYRLYDREGTNFIFVNRQNLIDVLKDSPFYIDTFSNHESLDPDYEPTWDIRDFH